MFGVYLLVMMTGGIAYIAGLTDGKHWQYMRRFRRSKNGRFTK